MGYREKAATRHKCSNKKRVQCRYSTFGPGSRTHVTNLLNEGATAIIDLIERVERAERENQRLRELVNADREGRCIVLPCDEFFERLGDYVFTIENGKILEVLLCYIGYDMNGVDCVEAAYSPGYENEKRFEFRFSDVGKSVFLTKEEAENVLKEKGV